MKRATKYVTLLFGIFMVGASTSKQFVDMHKANWLIGTWENKTQKGSVYETWSKTSDREFSGKSYILQGKDTVVFETILLKQDHDTVFYIPSVKSQNGGLPVRFSGKIVSDTQLVFENLKHDFPQVIIYTRVSADSLVAVISGTRNGQNSQQRFPMKRVR